MKARAHLYISGRVQGVFYRVNTVKEAHQRGVTGWVRNLPDGRVEAVFEGEKRLIDEMIKWCRKGPSYANVTNVEVNWENYTGKYTAFSTRYY